MSGDRSRRTPIGEEMGTYSIYNDCPPSNLDELYRLRLRIIQQEKEIEALRRDKEELRRECSFLRGYREAMRGE